MAGRHSDYTDEMAEIICMRLAEGDSLRKICSDEDMPSKTSVFRWLAKNSSFRDQYAQAKEMGCQVWAEEIIDIADDGSNDWMEQLDKDGEVAGYRLNGEHVQRSKLRVDSRKWLLSKLAPKKYGDRMAVDQKTELAGRVEHDHYVDLESALELLKEHGIDPSTI